MKILFLIIIGLIGGLLGGMGMGGGTITIPLLTLFLKVEQHRAQGINLIIFIPMSIFALIIHIKNKLIEKTVILPFLITAIISTVSTSILAFNTDSKILRIGFGVFLIILGCFFLITLTLKKIFSVIYIFKNILW